MRVFENASFGFIANRRTAYIFSLVVTLLGFASFFTRGFEMGIDFTGGKEFVVQTTAPVTVEAARSAINTAIQGSPEVKRYGDDLLVRIGNDAEGSMAEIGDQITAAVGSGATIGSSGEISPRFATDLQRGALYAVLASVIVIFLYILLRFEWTAGVGAIVSLLHDVIFTASVFSLLHGFLPFSLAIDQSIVAAFLTIVGYSINDTVVVFDRIREDRAKWKNLPIEEVANKAMNETLSRTMITGGTTILSLFVVFLFGGEAVRGFAFAMLIGIVLGTYSSVFIATPIMVDVQRWLARRGDKRYKTQVA